MKKAIIGLLIVFLGFGFGFFFGRMADPVKKVSFNQNELNTLKDIHEKCKAADIKGDIYFKKYGNEKIKDEPVNSKEWVDAQAWEQACSDAFQNLREQIRDEKK
jgi:hypothetical protein